MNIEVRADPRVRAPVLEVPNLPYTEGNPYQRLLYADPAGRIRPVAWRHAWHRLARARRRGALPVVHLHWDDRIFGRGADPAANRAEAEALLGHLGRYREAGGRLLWTIHNRRPHREIDAQTFAAARARLAAMADAIHVHAPHAAAHMREAWQAPAERLHVLPHPSYLGAYEPEIDTLARPLPAAAERRFLFFGMFRGQKGVSRIAEAADKLARRGHRFRLEMAGRAFASQRRLLARLAANPAIELFPERVPDEQVAPVFARNQLFLFPNHDVFTSGSVMLALTFGLPVIGPRVPALVETLPEGNRALLYDPESPRGLIRAMRDAIEMEDAELARLRAEALAFARERAPRVIGRRMADLILTLAQGDPAHGPRQSV